MKFVILSHAYDQFLVDFYASRQELASASFQAQRQAYYETLFGSADFYGHAIRRLGHDCEEFIYNALPMQEAWLKDRAGSDDRENASERHRGVSDAVFQFIVRHGGAIDAASKAVRGTALRRLKALGRPLLRRMDRAWSVVREQVRAVRPDVLFIQSMFAFADDQLAELRKHAGRVIGQHAATKLPDRIDYRLYDLVMSSFPPTVEYLRSRGARAELVRLAFDPRVMKIIPETRRDVEVTFSGSLFGVHSSRLSLLEEVAAAFPRLEIHAGTELSLRADSLLPSRIRSPVWGRHMYQLLRRSVATLNHHGDVPPFANNMRLYEATGMGCLLVTDWKENLGDMFEPEKEVLSYKDAGECVDKLRFYLAPQNETARARIMTAGQRRTLSEHTYDARMRQLLDLLRAA